MKKPALYLLSNLIFVTNLFSMQHTAHHYRNSPFGQIGPWENSLSDQFRNLTPEAIHHFRAIKKILDFFRRISNKNICIERLQPGKNQTLCGLLLKIVDHRKLFLNTPWGGITCYGKKLDCSSLDDHHLFQFITATRDTVYEAESGDFVESCNITAVDGESLPCPIANNLAWLRHFSVAQGNEPFTPRIWSLLEHLYQKSTNHAELTLCTALHARLGNNSPLQSLCPYLIRYIGNFLRANYYMYTPKNCKIIDVESIHLHHKRIGDGTDERPSKIRKHNN